jgi:hypothetical protein
VKRTALLLLAVLLTNGCGNAKPAARDVPGTAPAQPTVGEAKPTATQAPAPSGWKSFADGAFAGYIRDGWAEAYIDTTKFDSAGRSDLPASIQQAVSQFLKSSTAQRVFFVFLDFGPGFATNVNALPCEAAGLAQTIAKDSAVYLNYLKSQSISASVVDKVSYLGQPADLFRLETGSTQFDSYQVYLHTDDCFNAVTLSTRQGDMAQLADFKTFLRFLRVDPKVLGQYMPDAIR